MFRRVLAATLILATACSPALAQEWKRIGKGPSLERAKAECDLMAMGYTRGFFLAAGDRDFLVASIFGSVVANAIAQRRVYTNCMTIKGWQVKQAAVGKQAKAKTNFNRQSGGK
jgi:hypothetical protein